MAESLVRDAGLHAGWKALIRQLLPGIVLPGSIYFICVRWLPVVLALAVASSVPLLDLLVRALQGKRPRPAGLIFVAFAGGSVGLALALHSPMFILIKGAVISGLVGVAFAASAVMRRPLTRTLAEDSGCAAAPATPRAFAMPKSVTLATPSPVSKMLPGLTSRWTSPCS